jgi:hypothetical protein
VQMVPTRYGYACAGTLDMSCAFAAVSTEVMRDHIRRCHPELRLRSYRACYRQGVRVQTLFAGQTKWIEVVTVSPSVSNPTNAEMASFVVRHIIPNRPTTLPAPVLPSAPAELDREITRFLHFTRWVPHMRAYREDPERHFVLLTLRDRRYAPDEVGYTRIKPTFIEYIRRGASAVGMGWGVSYGGLSNLSMSVRQHLLHGRRLGPGG